MLRKLFFFLITVISFTNTLAQTDSSHLRISLLTCGTGDQIWETFGHNGVRVIDSLHHTDMVYNYGTFNGFDKDFELQFMRGKLLYYVSFYPFTDFMQEYKEGGRSVEEQVFDMSGYQKEQVFTFLKNNSLEENRYYKYDFFFDNCATRIRDILPNERVFGTKFHYGQVLPNNSKITFRDIINKYLYRKPWEKFGINILLGSKIDKVMSNKDIMFLPDFLRDGLVTATVDGKKVVAPTQLILTGSPVQPSFTDQPFLLTCIIALLTIAGLFVKRLNILGKVMSVLLLVVTGLLGILILVMWFGTDHQACHNNYNLLWALPTNIVLAFVYNRGKGKDRYAVIGIFFMVISLLLHILGVQALPLKEMFPLMIALLCIYASIFKKSQLKNKQVDAVPANA